MHATHLKSEFRKWVPLARWNCPRDKLGGWAFRHRQHRGDNGEGRGEGGYVHNIYIYIYMFEPWASGSSQRSERSWRSRTLLCVLRALFCTPRALRSVLSRMLKEAVRDCHGTTALCIILLCSLSLCACICTGSHYSHVYRTSL